MHAALLIAALVLAALWVVSLIVRSIFHVVSWAVHLILVAAVVLLVIHLATQ